MNKTTTKKVTKKKAVKKPTKKKAAVDAKKLNELHNSIQGAYKLSPDNMNETAAALGAWLAFLASKMSMRQRIKTAWRVLTVKAQRGESATK